MDSTDIDLDTWQAFKTKMGVDIATTIQDTRTGMDALIRASAAKQDGLNQFAALVAPQSFDELITYGIANSYVPVEDTEQDAFLLSQLKIVDELRQKDDDTIALRTTEIDEYNAADYTLALMISSVEATTLSSLIDYADDQEWYDADKDPSSDAFDASKAALLATLHQQALDLASAIFLRSGELQAQADAYSDLADAIEAMTWTEFQDYLASL